MNEIALIGKKIGMTREFYKTGQSVPVTVLKIEKGRVIDVIDEQKRGYKAVQLGFGNIKTSKLSKAMKGFFAKKNTEPKKTLKEFRVEKIENYKPGNEFGLEIFKDTKFVDIRSKTIGKGFAGNQKRHNFSRGPMTHGSKNHGLPGSIGAGSTPGRVYPGKKMAGQLGNKICTLKKIEIIGIYKEENLLILKGSIQGKPGNLLSIKRSS